MPKGAVNRLETWLVVLRYCLPAWLLVALALLVDHPASLILLLMADTVLMTGICRAIGFDLEATFARSLARRGLTYFVVLTAYTAFVAALLAAPAWWLSREDSLPAALALSAALAVSLLAIWRIWPVFVLPFVWDDAYPPDEYEGSWLSAALQRSLAFARHLTGENELFFAYTLPAAMALLLLAGGALALSGVGGLFTGEVRSAGLVIYGALLAPMAHVVLVNRGLHALLAGARQDRRRRSEAESSAAVTEEFPTADGSGSGLPPGIGQADLNATLVCAVQSAQTSLALAALERGADADAVPGPEQRDQRSALTIATTLPDLRVLRALIAKGADVNRRHGGITPLLAATRDSYQGRPDAVTTLLANGADARLGDESGQTPLHHAARCTEPIIAALLLDAAADIDAVDREGMTALNIACANANWPVATFLLERRAKPNVDGAQPALWLAAGVASDDPTGVKLLLKYKAQVDQRGPMQRTPLMAAALAGHPRIADALLGAGADPNLADDRGTTALMEAARSGAVGVIHSLGQHKVEPNSVDASGRSALIIACQSRHAGEDAVRALLALGADRSLTGPDGRRALDHAAAAGRWHVVALLDPAYPLPASLGGEPPVTLEASADHLLDALRFAHWNVAAQFADALSGWPASALADLYLDLAEPDQTAARTWLLNHGLSGDARLSDGRLLLDALVAELPASATALDQWVTSGAALGGSALVARVLVQAPAGEEGDRVRAIARDILDRGGDAFGSTSQRTALHLAAAQGDAGLSRRLLELGVDADVRDAQGRTPLHLAFKCEPGRAEAMVQLLVRFGASPEIATANGETPLGLALARDESRYSTWLNWTSWRLPGRPLRDADLPAAAAMGDSEAVERLIALGLSIDGEDAKGATALIRAAGSGHAALVVQLLAAGADVGRVTRSGMHCLAAAVSAGREAVVRTLLHHHIAPDLPLAGGGTALMIAAALGQTGIAAALLEAGADANASDAQGMTPMHAAAQYAFDTGDSRNARTLFELLMQADARLDQRNEAGQDALLILLGARAQPGARCDAEHLTRMAGLLLERGAKVDTQDQRGVGVLHACALHGLYGCARLLKAHGAPLDLVDGFGRSAADVAAVLGYVDVASELGAVPAPMPGVRQTLRRPARTPD